VNDRVPFGITEGWKNQTKEPENMRPYQSDIFVPFLRRLSFCTLSFILVFALTFSSPIANAQPSSDEEDCGAYYFGIDAAPDFKKALDCYKAQGVWEFLILMHLNGEGVPADVKKADELFNEWKKSAPEEVESLQAEALQKAIEERKADPTKTYPRLDYCDDIAQDTVTLNFCSSIKEQIGEIRQEQFNTALRQKLSPADAAVFDKVIAAFAAFSDAEKDRIYQQYAQGSANVIITLGQAAFVREQYQKLLKETIEERGLKPASEKDYKAADDELNRVYRESIRDYQETYEELIKTADSNEDRTSYKESIEEFKKLSKKTQLEWIKYRDLCGELARSVYKDTAKNFDPALAMKAAITRIRVEELNDDKM
jgi:uncharacterized protein YecT (DUF1311 family)